ncbi:MAG: hypothetical protein J6Z49_11785 [Kiritimatiellae bacterium]|nr:hypothetical protein [Kiritimatiellia bacterium]
MKAILLVLFMATVWIAGCASTVVEDTRTPVIEMNRFGDLLFHGEKLEPGRICTTLRRAGVRKGQEINIRIPPKADRRMMGHIAGELNRGGFTRVVFTTNRAANSTVQTYTGKLPIQETPPPPPPQVLRRPR